MKKVFLDNLPKSNHNGGSINWNESTGCKVKFIYNDIKGNMEILSYNKAILKIKYNDREFNIRTGEFKNCRIGRILGVISSDFRYKIGQILIDCNDDNSIKRDIIITDREYKEKSKIDKLGRKYIENQKWYKYTCNVCGWTEGWMEESNLLKITGCSCCYGRTVIKGINDIATTHPYLVEYFVNIEDTYLHTYASHNKVWIKCPDCGFEKKMIIANIYNQGFSCPKCSDKIPMGEKEFASFLDYLQINFQTQLSKTTFKWCDKYRYDFYFELNNEQYIIETHGLQHYEENSKFKMSLKETQENDRIKKNLALNNGIKPENYIVIDCRCSNLEFIKQNILNSKLYNIFDLSKIDWNKIFKETLKSKVKETCELKKNNPNLTISQMCEIINVVHSTIYKWLKIGEKLGLC